MQKLWITNLVNLQPNAKRKDPLMMIHTVEGDGSVKVHFLSPELAAEAGIEARIVSNMEKGQLIGLGASFDSRGRLRLVKKA